MLFNTLVLSKACAIGISNEFICEIGIPQLIRYNIYFTLHLQKNDEIISLVVQRQ